MKVTEVHQVVQAKSLISKMGLGFPYDLNLDDALKNCLYSSRFQAFVF